MVEQLALFSRMLLIGVVIAAPVGAMAVLIIGRTLTHGWLSGFATGGGIAMADAMYAAFAAFGVSAVSQWLIDYQAPLRIVGGGVLIWLGWRALRTVTPHSPTDPTSERVSYLSQFSSAFGLTATNPMTIMAFAAVFAGAGLIAQPGIGSAIAVTLGIGIGSLLWWILLITIMWAVRHALSDRAMLWINRVSGAMLAGFGVLALVAGLTAF